MEKGFRRKIALIVLAAMIGMTAAAGCGQTEESSSSISSSSSAAGTASSEQTSRISSQAVSSKAAVSDEDKIIDATKKEFKEENFISVDYSQVTHFALIKAKGKESLTSKMTVKGMYISIANVLEKLKEIKDVDIAFNIVYPLQDKSGNSTDTIVIKATYKSATRNKINWGKFLWKNIPDVADEWWIHNALKTALE